MRLLSNEELFWIAGGDGGDGDSDGGSSDSGCSSDSSCDSGPGDSGSSDSGYSGNGSGGDEGGLDNSGSWDTGPADQGSVDDENAQAVTDAYNENPTFGAFMDAFNQAAQQNFVGFTEDQFAAIDWGEVGAGLAAVTLGTFIASTPVGWVGIAAATFLSGMGGGGNWRRNA